MTSTKKGPTTALDDDSITARLSTTPAWERRQEQLYRAFIFDDFSAAFSFMSQVAALAERTDHHPTWSNQYNRVEIYLSTHSCNGISEKDFLLAQAIDGLLLSGDFSDS